MAIDCNEIIPGRLWVGGYVTPEDAGSLGQMMITTVVSLQSDEDLAHYRISEKRLIEAFEEHGIRLRRCPITDFSRGEISAKLPACVAEIEAALRPESARVYLHCTAGINRAPTAAAAYLIRSGGMSAGKARDLVTSRRHCSPYLDVLELYAEWLAFGEGETG